MADNIIKGTIWSAVQRFGSLGIGFISNMVLARLLCPEDFGVMGMVMVFVGLADVLVDGGLGNALIQKKNVDDRDLSTVFTSNFLFSIFLFTLFIICAPIVERYTDIQNLALFIRVESIQIIVRALYVIPFSLLMKEMNFNRLAKLNLIATFLSVAVGISCAYCGLGVWSLVLKNITLDVTLLFFYTLFGRKFFRFGFYKDSFRELFGFGFFVVLSNLIETAYTNIISFFIGKKYTVKELGYYNQAHSLQQIPTYSITAILNQVLFPYFSKMQGDERQQQTKLRMSILLITFFVFPLLIFLICFADQVIILLYSEKWIPCVPYFQILCISGLVNALIHINRSMLKSKGRTKLIFKLQICSALIGASLLLVGLQFSMVAAVSALAINGLLLYMMTSYYTGKVSEYSIFHQIKDISPSFLLSVVCIGFSYLIFEKVHFPIVVNLILELFVFFSIYLLANIIFKTKSWVLLFPMIKTIINKK